MKPAYKITVNGSDITQTIAGRLVQLSITDEAGVNSDRVEITLDDRDQRLSIPPTKAELAVSIGYEGGALVSKGIFVIEEVQLDGPNRVMTMRGTATGASRGAGASRRVSWHETTLGKIAESIASRNKWKLAISPELADVEIKHEDQRENDLQFLSRIAADNDAVVKVTEGRLIVNPHATGKRTSGGDIPAVRIVANDVTDWNVTLAERGSYDGIKATYQDMEKGERGEVVDGEDTDNTTEMTHVYKSKEAAEKATKARRKALERGKATFSVSNLQGDPTLRAEVKVLAEGFRKGVDGEWLANRVTHRIGNGGYICAIECETPESAADKNKTEE